MTKLEAYRILAKMWNDATPEQDEAINIAMDCIEFVDLMPDGMVAVVRCKDCKHRGDHEVCPLHDIRLCFDGDGHMDQVEDDKTEDEFFCSYGEQKEAEGDG